MLSANHKKHKHLLRIALYGPAVILAILISWGATSSVTARPNSDITQQGSGLDLTAVFTSDTIALGNISTLYLTMTNNDAVPHSSVALTNTLPTNVVFATPANPTTTCNGTLSASDGGNTLIYESGRLGENESCVIQVNVTSSTPGTHTNTSDNLVSDIGSYAGASDNLEVATDRPSFTMAVSPDRITPNTVSRVTYTIENNNGLLLSGYFTHQLPEGLSIATPPNATTDCFVGTVNATAGDATISLSGGAFSENSTCTIGVDVVATLPAIYNLVTGDFNVNSKTSGAAGAILDARTQPIIKSFTDDPVGSGDTVTLQYTIANYDRGWELTDLAFTDDLNAALSGLAATGLPLNDVCGSGSTLSGTSLLNLTGGNIPPEGNCTFEVTLNVPAGAATGSYPSTTSNLTGQQDGSSFIGDPAADTLVINPVPNITKTFLTTSAKAGDEVVVEFTISNTSPAESATSVTFLDNLTEFIVGTTTSNLPTDSCGAGSSLTYSFIDTDIWGLQLTNGTIPAASSCTFTATLQLPAVIPQGIYINTVGTISADVLGVTYEGNPASDSITIIEPPKLYADFVNTPVFPGDSVDLVYTIDHMGSDDAIPINVATNITFTHDLGSIMPGIEATGLPIANGCGSGSTLSGTSTISLTSGDLQPGTACTMTVTVQVPISATVGTHTFTTSSINATMGGQALSGPAVSAELDITTLSFSQTFIPKTALPGELISLEFTITNHSPTHDATGMFFTSNLGATISGFASTSGTLNNICGSGSSLTGTTFFIFTAGNIAPGSSCTFSISVQVPAGATNGSYNNRTSNLSATIDGSNVALDPSSATLVIDSSRLELTKEFTGASNLPGVTSSLVYTITNLDTDNPIDSITFTDDLDAVLTGLQASGLPDSNVCGSGSSLTGSSTITLTSASIAAGDSCSFSVSVSVPLSADAGIYDSTSSQVTGQINSLAVDGTSATSSLEVSQLSFSYSFDSAGAPNTIVPLTFMISNPIEVSTFENIAFDNELDITLTGLTAVNLPLTDVCGPGSMLSGGSTLTLSGGTLREFGFCTFTVDVKLPKNVPLDSYVDTINGLSKSGILISLPVSTTLSIVRPEVSFDTATTSITDVRPGQPVSYTLTTSNSGVGTATDIVFENVASAELVVTDIVTSSVPFTLTTMGAQASVGTEQITPGNSASVQVNAVISPALNSDQTISHTLMVTSTADVSPTNNSQSIMFNLTVPRTQLDANSTNVTVSEEDGAVTLTMTLDSPNPYAPIEVFYQTTSGSAKAGSDFTATNSGTVTIPAGSSQGTLTIPITNDALGEPNETFTVQFTGSAGGQLVGTQTATVTITDSDPARRFYLPVALHDSNGLQAPDLVVDAILIDGSNISVVIRNKGNQSVVNPFWVDLIVNPAIPPTQVNDTAEVLNTDGLVWGVEGTQIPLAAGETVTLTVGDLYFRNELSTLNGSISAGVPVYAHVDSANSTTTYGAVEESHEISGAAYNNILQITTSADVEISTTVSNGANGRLTQSSSQLPNRP